MRRALVVEDDALGGMLLQDMLTHLGWTVCGPCASLGEGLRAAREEAFGIALLDVNLAGEMCFPIADALDARGVPYVFITGYGETGLDLEERRAPVLSKPFTDKMLSKAIEALGVRTEAQ
jgi:DNA-binding response OmpR family regulator